jgi:hypothetical protein
MQMASDARSPSRATSGSETPDDVEVTQAQIAKVWRRAIVKSTARSGTRSDNGPPTALRKRLPDRVELHPIREQQKAPRRVLGAHRGWRARSRVAPSLVQYTNVRALAGSPTAASELHHGHWLLNTHDGEHPSRVGSRTSGDTLEFWYHPLTLAPAAND